MTADAQRGHWEALSRKMDEMGYHAPEVLPGAALDLVFVAMGYAVSLGVEHDDVIRAAVNAKPGHHGGIVPNELGELRSLNEGLRGDVLDAQAQLEEMTGWRDQALAELQEWESGERAQAAKRGEPAP